MAVPAVTKTKRTSWTRYYLFDFGGFDELVDGETLVDEPVISCTPSGLEVGEPTINGGAVQGLLSGGIVGTTYRLDCTVTTSGGATLSQVGYLSVIA